MPTLTRWFIKSSLVYLVVAMAMGLLLLVQPVLGLSNSIQSLKPVYLHCIFIGWVTQLIMGVGYWMFPKQSREKPRGSERLAWVVYVCLNLGMILRIVSEPAVLWGPGGAMGWIVSIASMLLLIAGWGYIVLVWGRIKER